MPEAVTTEVHEYIPPPHSIHRITHWMRELNRMKPDVRERDEWLRQHCGKLEEKPDTTHGWSLPMTREAYRELVRFKKNKPKVRRGENQTPVHWPVIIFPK